MGDASDDQGYYPSPQRAKARSKARRKGTVVERPNDQSHSDFATLYGLSPSLESPATNRDLVRVTNTAEQLGEESPQRSLELPLPTTHPQYLPCREEAVRQFLNGISNQLPCVFLCTGKPSHCQILQVRVHGDFDDDVAVWESLKQGWTKSRRRWPFRKVVLVEEVSFRFAGQRKSKGVDVFIGTYDIIMPEELRKELESDLSRIEEHISVNIRLDYAEYPCLQNGSTGHWEHVWPCLKPNDETQPCLYMHRADKRRRLSGLSLIPMLTLAFRDPCLGKGQHLINGLARYTSGIYSSPDMFQGMHGRELRLGDITFDGYLVTDDWNWPVCGLVGAFVVSMLVISVPVFKVIFGDWQTGMTATTIMATILGPIVPLILYLSQDD